MMFNKSKGFTLLEIAITIGVIALLLGSLLVPLTVQVEQRQVSETEKSLDEIRSALLGYAIAYGYLPCPAIGNSGIENVTSGQCTGMSSNIAHGNLPWQTLGITNNSDAWGNRFRYAVRDEYARRPSPTLPASFTLATTTADLRVRPATGATTSLTATAVAIVLSHGRNGYGATNSSSGTAYVNPSTNDELENTNTDRDFVYRIRTDSGATVGEFDDIVTWIALPVLFNKMVTAGKLP